MMNGAIRAREVRLIGAEGEQLGVTPTSEALMQAENLNMDLVLISTKNHLLQKSWIIQNSCLSKRKNKKKQRKNKLLFL